MRERPASTASPAPDARHFVPHVDVASFVPTALAFVLSFMLVALGLTACDAELLADAPADRCTEVGVQCVLPTGPLGVCERSTCESGALEPCFACVSQH